MQGETQPRRILIVEDNDLNLKLLNDILEFRGYMTLVAASGATAIELARLYRPDLILLDIQLPDLPGTEVVRQLKADSQTRLIPVIAVTAFAMSGDRERCLQSGCDEYVAKPYSIDDLLNTVERYWAA